jgi:hypothetical protein
MLSQSGLLFAPNQTIFHNTLDGIPRGCMPTEFDIYILLYSLFPTLVAYNINIILIHLIAFIGMYMLLGDYLFKNSWRAHKTYIALAFSLISFWPSGELSVAGQPIVVWAFLNLSHKDYSLKNWIILLLFPFYSGGFVFSNLFFGIALFIFLLANSTLTKKRSFKPFLALFIFYTLTVVSDYRLFIMQFIEHFQSQRNLSMAQSTLNIKGYLGCIACLFLKGQYHFHSQAWPIISALTILTLFIATRKQRYFIAISFFAIILSSALYTFHLWSSSNYLLDKLGALKSVELRFITISPLLWYLVFALAIYVILQKYSKSRCLCLNIILVVIILNMFGICTKDFQGDTFSENTFYHTYFDNKNSDYKSFEDYYCPSLFNDIKKNIHYNNETILCIGFPSEIAQYNGMYTAASYYAFLPSNSVEKLINIFRPELKKLNNLDKETLVTNSRRFQYFVANTKKTDTKILNLDTIALKAMHIHYIMSSISIGNYSELGYSYLFSLNNAGLFPNHIYVYSLKS